MPDYNKIADSVKIPEGIVPPADVEKVQKDWYSLDHERYQGLAEAKGYDQEHQRLQAVRYTHEAMIDVIIARPEIKQNELAKMFERSVPWISRIIGSDSFQAALAKRREELSDPFLVATVEERFKGLAMQSLDIIAEKLETTKNVDLALKSLDVSVKAMGYGARAGSGNVQNNFVVQLPPKSANPEDWAAEHGPMKRIGNG